MKRTMKKILAAALGAAMLISAGAMAGAVVDMDDVQPDNVLINGVAEKWEDGERFIVRTQDSESDLDVVLNISDETRIIDAVTGEPAELRENESVYAYISRAMTLSLPPQAHAELIICNIPQDYKVPAFYTVVSTENDGDVLKIKTDKGEDISVKADCEYTPYLTKNVVGAADLVPGTEILVWSDGEGADKIMIFPYSHRGYIEVAADGTVSVNGEAVEVKAYAKGETMMLPLRSVCEALGYTVGWDNDRRAANVANEDDRIFDAAIGSESVLIGEESDSLYTPAELTDSKTFIADLDFERFLDVRVYVK